LDSEPWENTAGPVLLLGAPTGAENLRFEIDSSLERWRLLPSAIRNDVGT